MAANAELTVNVLSTSGKFWLSEKLKHKTFVDYYYF